MQSHMILNVVNMTMIEKMKVQIGSTIRHSGLKQTTREAMTIPTDWTMSPMIWIKAALTFTFSDFEVLTELLW